MINIVCILLIFLCGTHLLYQGTGLVSAQNLRWYYTGLFRNGELKKSDDGMFMGAVVDFSSLFVDSKGIDKDYSEMERYWLYNGGNFLKLISVNTTVDNILTTAVNNELPYGGEISSLSSSHYQLLASIKYSAPPSKLDNANESVHYSSISANHILQSEIGLYDHATGRFQEKLFRDVSFSFLIAVEVKMTTTQSVYNGIEWVVDVINEKHKLVFTSDFRQRLSVISHTQVLQPPVNDEEINDVITKASEPMASSIVDEQGNTIDLFVENNSSKQPTASITRSYEGPLRVMTYNLWHNSPPRWAYHDNDRRWVRYNERLRHFADIVVAEDPDVLTVQEVRLDSTFLSSPTGALEHWNHWSKSDKEVADLDESHKIDAGTQVEHLLSHLSKAWERRRKNPKGTKYSDENSSAHSPQGDDGGGDDDDDDDDRWRSRADGGSNMRSDSGRHNIYQHVYHPAMSMFDKKQLFSRVEEGVLILSKLPIIQSDSLLLPRDMLDGSDDHQRVVLRVQVGVPVSSAIIDTTANDTTSTSIVPVDVMTTHLSLSTVARVRSVATITEWCVCEPTDEKELSASSLLHPRQTPAGYSTPHQPAAVQILTGDFNAEPHEDAFKSLLNEDAFQHTQNGVCRGPIRSASGRNNPSRSSRPPAAFVDTWAAVHGDNEEMGLTFPACNPVKRIDFILVRNHSSPSSSSNSGDDSIDESVEDLPSTGSAPVASPNQPGSFPKSSYAIIADSRVIGKQPPPGTPHYGNRRDGLGMLDGDSPLWASDHFAVTTDLIIHHES